MKKLLTLACLLIASAGAGAGFKAGSIWQIRQDQQLAVSQNVAHYDMRTRDFTWGSPDEVNLINSRVVDLMDDARIPARKPHHD